MDADGASNQRVASLFSPRAPEPAPEAPSAELPAVTRPSPPDPGEWQQARAIGKLVEKVHALERALEEDRNRWTSALAAMEQRLPSAMAAMEQRLFGSYEASSTKAGFSPTAWEGEEGEKRTASVPSLRFSMALDARFAKLEGQLSSSTDEAKALTKASEVDRIEVEHMSEQIRFLETRVSELEGTHAAKPLSVNEDAEASAWHHLREAAESTQRKAEAISSLGRLLAIRQAGLSSGEESSPLSANEADEASAAWQQVRLAIESTQCKAEAIARLGSPAEAEAIESTQLRAEAIAGPESVDDECV